MTVKIEHGGQYQGSISVNEMKNGDIGVITKWRLSGYIGYLVQKTIPPTGGYMLVSLGRSDSNFTMIFNDGNKNEDCRVNLVKKLVYYT